MSANGGIFRNEISEQATYEIVGGGPRHLKRWKDERYKRTKRALEELTQAGTMPARRVCDRSGTPRSEEQSLLRDVRVMASAETGFVGTVAVVARGGIWDCRPSRQRLLVWLRMQ